MTAIGNDPDPAATHQEWMNELNGARRPARLVLPGTASEAEWLEARRQGITASEISVVMGLSSFSSPFKLYHQKTGQLGADEQGDRLRLGHVLEPYIADRFAERCPEFIAVGDGRKLFAHPGRPWQMATPDRMLFESGAGYIGDRALAVLEAKSWGTFDGWGPDGSDEIPVHIRCQVLWQMDVMDVTTGYVACVFLPGAQLRVYELTMDDQAREDLRIMRAEAAMFLARIDAGNAPDVDWRPSTTDALKRLHPSVEEGGMYIGKALTRQYRAACRRYKEAEQRKKLCENRIRERLGKFNRALVDASEEVVATRQVYDVRAHQRKASTVDKIVPARQPKEQ